MSTSSLMFALAKLGEFSEYQALLERLRQLSRVARHPHYQRLCGGFTTLLAILQGRWSDAVRSAMADSEQASQQGITGLEGRFGFQMFSVQRALGGLDSVGPLLARFGAEDEQARAWLPGKILLHCELGQRRQARDALQRLGHAAQLPHDDLYETALVYLAESCAQLRDITRCRQLYRLLEPYRDCNVVLHGILSHGSGAGYLALLAVALRRHAEAKRLFEQAIEFNARMGAAPILTRTRVDYAALLNASEVPADRAYARQLLAEARATADRLRMNKLMQRIDELAGAGNGVEGLTNRELAVLALISQGASNKRIADQLHVSAATVATHVRNILRKTGTRNRTEAVAHARRCNILPSD